MMLFYLIAVISIAVCIGLMRSRSAVRGVASVFYASQIVFTALLCVWHTGEKDSLFFTFDELGVLFMLLMTVVSTVAFYQSDRYLDTESVRHYRIYNVSLIALCAAASAVYFSDNVAVTWIFLEATTLATAGLVYHRRAARSLEATWKYIFICSTGLAIAYLGILLLSTVAAHGDISYVNLARQVVDGNPLYLKIAFLLILVGYSCKLEIFPLYTIGVDANFAAPTSASAVISTVLVNAGFVSVFRIYKVIMASGISSWAANVMVIIGVVSVFIGAFFLRRTNSYKRFMSYSTVENMGLVIIGLGLGGIALYAALFHVVAHTLIKSGMFFNIAQIGKLYGSYRINRIGNYMKVNRLGAVSILLGMVCLLAFPPSAFFVSELLIFKQAIVSQKWWLLVLIVLAVCYVMFSLCYRLLSLCYKPSDISSIDGGSVSRFVAWTALGLIVLSMVLGVWQPAFFTDYLNAIANG